MTGNPLNTIKKADPDLFGLIEQGGELTFSEEGIPLQYKFLIAMALDASKGAENGVRNLATQAINAGATKEEVMQAVRIANYVSGVGSVHIAANALKDIV
ncbi:MULTISPECIES: carboxymuconolactone decarboxylase family protein [Methanohalophilus]|jgi:alkylhydroperoxidase/carboxymuconolactone decarboxylase family protein YurZ|uniref:Carboxymuconolactone decarboxylase family protein n=1 Tax=Methanohalophilus euhalobius TaxID=51203 RepID=A0A285EKU1_9EURY|nr:MULTISPECIES: carboxymuconolactone decarboxylase family protein [Methanohalophilus]KXS46772.1 MAG: carboxymuconolactone decarboxylase [Methanohalophilus sp. T328-1]RSD33768.1 MAG: carboxymuconolactone decarboxylase [Methanohalophilus sp.]OBZ36025.1 MAG: 4-carboxymuconolactone decarboxylase [Methanohalophilus sp. DAL1]ODV49194.1 MAG: carboxymuconolactone decarboxylase [Methanohalophilus sp. 2-GBenrich]PQV43512.1 alkylhydroperoxidase/carboxymuconolactone decarboxylase family protein YurZ [Met